MKPIKRLNHNSFIGCTALGLVAAFVNDWVQNHKDRELVSITCDSNRDMYTVWWNELNE